MTHVQNGREKAQSFSRPLIVYFAILRLLRYGIHADLFLAFAHFLKAYDAVRQSEERIVASLADVRAGMDLRTSLANQNVAGEHALTIAAFRTETFCLAVTTVMGRTRTFFMSE